MRTFWQVRTWAAVIFAVIGMAVGAIAQELPRIAVYVTGNVGADEKKVLGTRMLSTLVNSKRYRGIERSNSFLAEIEKEQEKQRSGAIDDNQISELGRQFGVKYVCIADITPAFGAFQVSARIVNVETAEVEFIGDATSPLKTIDDLTNVSEKVVNNMFGETAKTTAEHAAQEPPPAAVSQAKSEPAKPESATQRNATQETKPKSWLSVGIGGFFASDFGGQGVSIEGDSFYRTYPWLGGGVHLFFDATYVEIGIGFTVADVTCQLGVDTGVVIEHPTSANGLNIGVLGKYPISLGNNMTLYPAAGIDYFLCLDTDFYMGYNELPEFDAGKFSHLWLKFGAGYDHGFTDALFLRAQILYGIGFASGMAKWVDEETYYNASEYGMSHGLTIKAGVGFRL